MRNNLSIIPWIDKWQIYWREYKLYSFLRRPARFLSSPGRMLLQQEVGECSCACYRAILPWHTILQYWISTYSPTTHPPHRQTLQKLPVFYSIPLACLARELLSMQGKLVNNKQFLKQNFSETITPIDRSCMLLFNLWINPVLCWYCFFFLIGVDHIV